MAETNIGDDLPAFPVPGAGMDLPWAKVQRRIAQLIREDRFYTEAERDNLDDIDPIAIREALAERGIVNGELVDPEALERDPFLQQVAADVERIAQEGSGGFHTGRTAPGSGLV